MNPYTIVTAAIPRLQTSALIEDLAENPAIAANVETIAHLDLEDLGLYVLSRRFVTTANRFRDSAVDIANHWYMYTVLTRLVLVYKDIR